MGCENNNIGIPLFCGIDNGVSGTTLLKFASSGPPPDIRGFRDEICYTVHLLVPLTILKEEARQWHSDQN